MAGPDDAVPVADPAPVVVRQLLADPSTRVTIGVHGALAEFDRHAGEPMTRAGSCVVTPRGAVALTLPPGAQIIAYEVPTTRDLHWTQAVALCLDAATARMGARTVVTALGADAAALRPHDRAAERFDLGLGMPWVDACVRTDDAALLDALHAAGGAPLGPDLGALLVERGPHRVFSSACGRVEVYAPIPAPGGRSPDGPHTHLLLPLPAAPRTHPAAAPIPDDLVTCATLYPAHPDDEPRDPADPDGSDRYEAFQRILSTFGDPVAGAWKAMTAAAVQAGTAPDRTLVPRDAPSRAAVVVTLRQIARVDGPSETLDVWQARHPPDAELLHPDG